MNEETPSELQNRKFKEVRQGLWRLATFEDLIGSTWCKSRLATLNPASTPYAKLSTCPYRPLHIYLTDMIVLLISSSDTCPENLKGFSTVSLIHGLTHHDTE